MAEGLLGRLLLGRNPYLSSKGLPIALRHFSTADPTISEDAVVEGEAWTIEVDGAQTVRLFEVPDPDIGRCMLLYRAGMRSQNLTGKAYLEMWCRLPGRGEFFSRGVNQTLSGSAGWASFEIPFRLKKDQRPDLIKLNVVVEGQGRLWVKDVELLKMPA